MLKKLSSLLSLALLASLIALPAARAEGDTERDKAAEEVLNGFMQALLLENQDQSAKECMKWVHKSLLSKDGRDLSPDLRRFGHKKAHENAKFYDVP
ncbi:MAG: hypothetical protein ACK4N5_13945, partial [Myxococcales bacterium]